MGPKFKKCFCYFQISVSNESFVRKKNPFFKVITCGPARKAALEASKFSVNKANGCSKAHFLVNAQPAAAKAFSFAVQASYYIILQMGDFQAKRNSKSEQKITWFFLIKLKTEIQKLLSQNLLMVKNYLLSIRGPSRKIRGKH